MSEAKPKSFVWGLAKDWGVALVLVAVVVIGWQVFSSSGPSVGEPAPDFELPTPSGEMVRLSDLQGEVVVLNFWATWCGPCRAEIPALSAFQEAHPEVTLLGISVDDAMGAGGVQATARRLGADYTILLDPRSVAAGPYSVHTLPTTVIVAADGTVVDTAIGTVDERKLERMISE